MSKLIVTHRDTFWFFWLGWLGRIVPFLPNTEILWQELLTLREIRAAPWAKKTSRWAIISRDFTANGQRSSLPIS